MRAAVRLTCCAALLAATHVALGAPPAGAHKPTPAEIAVARRLFHEATALERKKQWDEAAGKLRKAIGIKDTPGLRYHLATCEEHSGKLVQALVDYDRAKEMLDDGVKAPDVERLLVPARDALKKRVPTLTVDVPADIDSATLELDGKPVASALVGQPTPLDPGHHTVRVSAPAHKSFEQSLDLKEGETRTIHAKLDASAPPEQAAPAPAAMAPVPADTGRHPFPARTATLIGEGVVTLAGLGVGIGFSLAASSQSSRADDARKSIDQTLGGRSDSSCFNPAPSVADACNALRDANTAHGRDTTIAAVGFIAAGVGAAAAVATWFLWRPAPSTKTALSFGATPLAGGAYWTARGTF